MTSRPHRERMLQLLGNTQVPIDTTPNDLGEIMAITSNENAITFSDKNLISSKGKHTDALYITVHVKGNQVPMVLIDNGSALNVCPLKVASVLGLGLDDFTPSRQIVCTYDNTKREVLGTITLEVNFGPVAFPIEFQVLDIASSFNLLLGRAWLHQAKAVPSTLHRMVKFPHSGGIVTIRGGALDLPAKQVHELDEDKEISLSGFVFEEVNTQTWGLEHQENFPLYYDPFSNTRIMGIMKKMDFLPFMGLGRHQQWIIEPPLIPTIIPSFGLGYKPTPEDIKRMEAGNRETSPC
ncbi:hypothetical protein Tsubulata_007795 [Turnera subulata]|uniref:Aspartic peptidase DDI1-type domain-containing protein n=1 Tax=Turnera subulata TaxID=218843 RepID=A0A9Q0FY92_9ROSI|nr:hypothetical protein Tsubulata_007795 [Turnera subulata]